MAIVFNFPTAMVGVEASRPRLGWASSITPTRHFVPQALPASGPIAAWTSSVTAASGGNVFSSSTPTTNPTVGTDGEVRYCKLDASNTIFRLMGLDPSTCRTVIVLGRTDTDDVYNGASALVPPLFLCGVKPVMQALTSDNAIMDGGNSPSLPAARGKWHMYAVSQPASAVGVFAVDGQSMPQDYGAGARDITQLWLGRAVDSGLPSETNARLRTFKVLEVLTVAEALTAPQLLELYTAVKEAYPTLAWG